MASRVRSSAFPPPGTPRRASRGAFAFAVSVAVHVAAVAGIAASTRIDLTRVAREVPGLVHVTIASAAPAAALLPAPRPARVPPPAALREASASAPPVPRALPVEALAAIDPGPVAVPVAPVALATPAPAAPAVRAVPVELAAIAVAAPASAPPAPVPDASPRYRSAPRPDYPAASREDEEEGVVTVRVLVSETGEPLRVELERSSGHRRLDAAALSGVMRWSFHPATREARAVEAWMQVPVRFVLR